MSDGAALSDERIRHIQWISFGFLCCNVAAFALSLTAILRYTSHSMRDLQPHLLNISVTVLVSDVVADVLAAPLPVYPHIGLVSVSWAGGWLARTLGNALALPIVAALTVTMLTAGAAAVCNATLHRFWVTKNAENRDKRTPRWLLGFMAIWQFGYMPLMGVLVATVEPVPDYALRLYEEQFPDTLARLSAHPHVIWLDAVRTFRENPAFAVGISMAVCMVVYDIGSTAVLAWWSLRLLDGMRLSGRVLRIRRQLVVAMLLQSFVPLFAYLLGLMLALAMLYFQLECVVALTMVGYLLISMHSVINCAVMCWAIQPYRRGLARLLGFEAARRVPRPAPRLSSLSTKT